MKEADDAVRAWGVPDTPPRLISHRENAVFDVSLFQHRAVLRLHRPGYRTRNEILSEIAWTTALSDAGFAAPRAMPLPDGQMVHQMPGGRLATLIAWMDGSPIGAADCALNGSVAEQVALYRTLGGLLAELHTVSDRLPLPEWFERPAWDNEGLAGEMPLWGRYWEAAGLTTDERQMVLRARDRAQERLADYRETADFGLIHADALRENVFRMAGGGLGLIDFDDGGFGYRMYDLAVCLSQSTDLPHYAVLTEALMEGYSARRPLGEIDRQTFPMFAMLRAFSSLGWTVPRLPPDHSRLPFYRHRALTLAKAFLKN